MGIGFKDMRDRSHMIDARARMGTNMHDRQFTAMPSCTMLHSNLVAVLDDDGTNDASPSATPQTSAYSAMQAGLANAPTDYVDLNNGGAEAKKTEAAAQ